MRMKISKLNQTLQSPKVLSYKGIYASLVSIHALE